MENKKSDFFYIPTKTITKTIFNFVFGTMIVYAFCTFMIFLEIGRYQLIECHSSKDSYYTRVFDTKTGMQKDFVRSNHYWE